MEKKQDEILGILRSGPPVALSSSGAGGARLNQALLTEWAKLVINVSKIVRLPVPRCDVSLQTGKRYKAVLFGSGF